MESFYAFDIPFNYAMINFSNQYFAFNSHKSDDILG